MIRFIADNKEVSVKVTEYSDGALAVNIDLSALSSFDKGTFTIDPSTKVYMIDTLIELFLDNLRINGVTYASLSLNLPYFPYARAERMFSDGDGIPLIPFIAKLHNHLQKQNIRFVYSVDIHSMKAIPSFVEETPQHKVVTLINALKWNNYDAIIAPDKGAKPKIQQLINCGYEFCPNIVLTATKIRDKDTGRITSICFDQKIPKDIKKVIIIDDILDQGGTFIPLAHELKSLGIEVHLHVTHLIAAGGLEKFRGYIDKIFCLHTVAGYITMDDVKNFNHDNTTIKREEK